MRGGGLRGDLHKPHVVLCPGRTMRHSAKTQVSCSWSSYLRGLCGSMQSCQGARQSWSPASRHSVKYLCNKCMNSWNSPSWVDYEERKQEMYILFWRNHMVQREVHILLCSGVRLLRVLNTGWQRSSWISLGKRALYRWLLSSSLTSYFVFEYEVLHLQRFLNVFAFCPPQSLPPCLWWVPTTLDENALH